ncbi:hypothetical protein DLAC_05520 [Tieghemostelium lacteum]|uniref:Uncharacterized protein n=1 Tax=Tieghemostelium lacteum TaxID=361077 RepID=A0A151ZG75_TIELA|nr:hypothetical protein DLAC_05520 [Tieghemostelium lacteum]|eukprot:KYQ92927.1 hypothetical protein DLAC_05520 [Tieghemostelium lacteum]
MANQITIIKLPVLPNNVIKYLIEIFVDSYYSDNYLNHSSFRMIDNVFFRFGMVCQQWMDRVLPSLEFKKPIYCNRAFTYIMLSRWVMLGVKFSNVVFGVGLIDDFEVQLLTMTKPYLRNSIGTLLVDRGYHFNSLRFQFEDIKALIFRESKYISQFAQYVSPLLNEGFSPIDTLTRVDIHYEVKIEHSDTDDVIQPLNLLCGKFINISDINIRGFNKNQKISRNIYRYTNVIQKLKILNLKFDFINVKDITVTLTHPFTCIETLKLHRTKTSPKGDIVMNEPLYHALETHPTITSLSLQLPGESIPSHTLTNLLNNTKLKSLKLKYKTIDFDKSYNSTFLTNNTITKLGLEIKNITFKLIDSICDKLPNLKLLKLAVYGQVDGKDIELFKPKSNITIKLTIVNSFKNMDAYLSKYSLHTRVNHLTLIIDNTNEKLLNNLLDNFNLLEKLKTLKTLFLDIPFTATLIPPLSSNTNIKHLIIRMPELKNMTRNDSDKNLLELIKGNRSLESIELTNPENPYLLELDIYLYIFLFFLKFADPQNLIKKYFISNMIKLPDIIIKNIIEISLDNYSAAIHNTHTPFLISAIDKIFCRFSLVCQRWFEKVIPTVEFRKTLFVSNSDIVLKLVNWIGLGVKFRDIVFNAFLTKHSMEVSMLLSTKPYLRNSLTTMVFDRGFNYTDIEYQYENVRALKLIFHTVIQYQNAPLVQTLQSDLFSSVDILTKIDASYRDKGVNYESENVIEVLHQICNKFINVDDIGLTGDKQTNKITSHLTQYPYIIKKLKRLQLVNGTVNSDDLVKILNHPFCSIHTLKLHNMKDNQIGSRLDQLLFPILEKHPSLTSLSLHFNNEDIQLQQINNLLNKPNLISLKLKYNNLITDQSTTSINNSIRILTLNFNEISFNSISNICNSLCNLNSLKVAIRGHSLTTTDMLLFQPKKQFFFELVIPYHSDQFDLLLDKDYPFHRIVNSLTLTTKFPISNLPLFEVQLKQIDRMIKLNTLYLSFPFPELLVNSIVNNTYIKNLIIYITEHSLGVNQRSAVLKDIVSRNKTLVTLETKGASVSFSDLKVHFKVHPTLLRIGSPASYESDAK